MKLTPSGCERTAELLEAWPLPETHPAAESLAELFGEHTFFLDGGGLFIVEAEAEEPELGDGAEMGRVMKLASWTDARRTVLAPHPREDTGVVVTLSEAA